MWRASGTSIFLSVATFARFGERAFGGIWLLVGPHWSRSWRRDDGPNHLLDWGVATCSYSTLAN